MFGIFRKSKADPISHMMRDMGKLKLLDEAVDASKIVSDVINAEMISAGEVRVIDLVSTSVSVENIVDKLW